MQSYLQPLSTKLFWLLELCSSVAQFLVNLWWKTLLFWWATRKEWKFECNLSTNRQPLETRLWPFPQHYNHLITWNNLFALWITLLHKSLKSICIPCNQHAVSCPDSELLPSDTPALHHSQPSAVQPHVEQHSAICCTLPKSVISCFMQCLSWGSRASGSGGCSSPV